MDTGQDFLFCNERIATKYNPFYENEYLIIQTYPREKRLIVEHRSFDYQQATSSCELKNLAHDYSSFGLRVFHDGKLWNVDWQGLPQSISKQQDWKITEEYQIASYDDNIDGEIIICDCSYPYFSSLVAHNTSGEAIEFWQPLTCLLEDNGREIERCPNCNISLVRIDESEDEDFDFDDQLTRPIACIGCANYHGVEYGGNVLVCAIHAQGWEDDNCPDFSPM
ncbi:hypothetical protein A6770_35505 [Nostoc minutum NIES-26]|uniref:Uncharacterized protein n=1 Tax=Nostoc minutum NIES-26 TaxID=1844469 RepID=A0A367RZH7_9NOSO|nr:hypothetical protein A6770_35505 [Nostoc minutum NIES-26]